MDLNKAIEVSSYYYENTNFCIISHRNRKISSLIISLLVSRASSEDVAN